MNKLPKGISGRLKEIVNNRNGNPNFLDLEKNTIY